MEEDQPPDRDQDAFWRDFLGRGHSKERAGRRVFKLIPSAPRCRLCAAPFSGVGAPLMRLIGKTASDKNPNWCASCFTFMSKHHGGAEIEITMLFADVRGSTTLAEGMQPTEFRRVMDRFYDVAATVVFGHDGFVDKFVGDEVVAMFFPLLTGQRHAARGIDAARELLTVTGHAGPGDPWIPLGAGLHTGTAWVGAVGSDTHTELTAVGDAVNTAARLASAAAPGEILVSAGAAGAAGLGQGLERRRLDLKGKAQPTDVVVLRTERRPSDGGARSRNS